MDTSFYLKNPWWENKKFDSSIPRPSYVDQIDKNLNQKLVQILTGLRRVGKSTITLQVIKHLIDKKKVNPERIIYFSIEDPKINDRPISDILNDFRIEFNIKASTKIFVFIDEIQFRNGWEREIKSLYDSEKVKFILTGSSAMLLSEKIAFLTGRYLKIQVRPLTFDEYLSFKKINFKRSEDHLLVRRAEEYLLDGGMPEYILNHPDRYLQTTVESILFKDLITKFELRDPRVLLDLVYLLADRVSITSSSLKLSKILEINKDTVLKYIEYLNAVFITSELQNYSTSRNKRIYNPPKIYFKDNGILQIHSSKTNLGALAENVIFNALQRFVSEHDRVNLGYWYENKHEVDFVLDINNEKFLFESKWIDRIDDFDKSSLVEAVSELSPAKSYVVTRSLDTTMKVGSTHIRFLPLYQFLQSDLIEIRI